jgi:hypothetical protein
MTFSFSYAKLNNSFIEIGNVALNGFTL